MSNMNPIFISGANRSGTTLLFALLASHPELSMVRRTDMWRYFYNRFDDLRQPANFERCLAAMLRYKRVLNLNPDPERIRREFQQGEKTYGRLFALIHQHRAERVGKPRWGDKSLHTEKYAAAVFHEFPQARMVHLIRDPRDRYTSVLKRLDADRRRVGVDTIKWLASTAAARQAREQFPDRFMIVRYETLAAAPERTLQEICHFVNLPYTPDMLSMTGDEDYYRKGGNSSFGKFKPGTISTRSIGRYRERISPAEIAFIQSVAGRTMKEFDYTVKPLSLSVSNRLQYLAAMPGGLLRMGRWLAVDWFRERRGRPLRKHRIVNNYRFTLQS